MSSPGNHSPLVQKLQSYLNHVGLEGLAPPGSIRVRSLALHEKQGLSNKTYLLRVEADGEMLDTLILRLYTGDGKASREFRLLKLLGTRGLPVPSVYAFDESRKVLGKPFLIMEMIKQTQPEDEQCLLEAAARSLAEIHSIKPSVLRGVLENKGNYPARELDGIRLLAAAMMFSTIGPPYTLVRCLKHANLLRRRMLEGRSLLIHGDYGLDNIVYSRGRAYVVDWESAEIAEPTFDVAYVCNFLGFLERIQAKPEGKLSETFLKNYEKHGGVVKQLELYRRLAAIKIILLLEVLRTRNLFSLLTGLHARFRSLEGENWVEGFRRYLFEKLGEQLEASV
ncbi:MAG: phosphotransferase [Candidatus Brockarchaeota archaeon]|nr:phosphotransferase [Candidatus Brockarchaeota archaeon]